MSNPNRRVAERIVNELFNQDAYDIVNELYCEELENHDVSLPEPPSSPAEIVELLKFHRRAFPDYEYELTKIVADEDSAAMRWVVRGTHTGPLGEIPPTGKPFAIDGMSILAFEDGKVRKIWQQFDTDGMQRQLGLAPQAASARANPLPS